MNENGLSKKSIDKILNNPKHMRKFRNAVEQAKKELTTGHQCQISIEAGDLELDDSLNRATFEHVCEPLFKRIQNVITKTM